MRHKLGFLLIAFGLALPTLAVAKPSTLSGYVRNSRGVPQMGAAVEVTGADSLSLKAFTDAHGFYSFASILPGTYSLKASAPSFLPSLRESVGVGSGAHLIVNLTLNTLFEALQMTPLRGNTDDDDWKWTLRSVSNRPILRALDDGTPVLASAEAKDSHELKGKLAFLAGSGAQGYGSTPDMTTRFAVEHSLFSSGTISLLGDVGYGESTPTAVFRTSYSHQLANGSTPAVTLTARRLAPPVPGLRTGPLQALALNTSDDFALGRVLELKFGSEMQTIEFMGRVNAFRPYGSADVHLSPNTVVEYQYASSVPNTRLEKGFDSAPADLSESGPRMSIDQFTPALEKAHHQELSLSRRLGDTRLQIAAFNDRITDPALVGVGETGLENGEVLPDLYSGTFTYQGRDLQTGGLRAVAQRKFGAGLTGTLDYGYGGVLALSQSGGPLSQAQELMRVQRRHAVGAKLSGNLPYAKTHWVTSYRWINGEALTPVDMFNASAGQMDPFLNVFVRQPLPACFPGHMEFLLDVRNLLAQGYVPVMGQDGHTIYLVQSARSVRGGLAFSF
jgi:hypothetical protein